MEEQLRTPMTTEEFHQEKSRLVALYGAAPREASGKRAQEFAMLYAKSGWTQRELAKHEGISQTSMFHKLIFGKFLLWLITNCNQPWTRTDGHFRTLWEATDQTQTDEERFMNVTAMIEAEKDKPPTPRGKHPIVKRLLAEFGDGEFHAVRVMATKLDVPQEKLLTTLDGMRLYGFHHTEAERRKAPHADGGWRYRLRPHRGHVVPYDTMREELKPLLDELRYHGQQDQYKLAPFVFTNMAHKIEQALEKLAR